MAIRTFINRLHVQLRLLRTAERGNVLLTFALLLVPVMGAVGAAVDFSRANNVRSQLQAAADAASVGSIAKSSPAVAAAASMSNDGPVAAGETDAVKIFNAQLAGKENLYTG
jgi:Flp pilus assembly protein TadG